MPKGFFVTGTDTGVGKTVITAALIKTIGLLGLKVCGMKPIETGCKIAVSSQQSAVSSKEKTLISSDGTFLKNISNVNESIDFITPVRFMNPLAPLPASEIEGISVDFKKIQKAYTELSKKYDVIIVEGIGGLLVPITRDYSVLDLAKDFGLPLLIVSRPGPGTINHTMLTVNYAIKEGLLVAGIIINYGHPPEDTLAEDTNPKVITQISPVPIIGIFPYLENFESDTIEKAVKNLDSEIIKKYLWIYYDALHIAGYYRGLIYDTRSVKDYLESVYKLSLRHSRENGNPVISIGSGFLLLQEWQKPEFMDRHYLKVAKGFIEKIKWG